MRKKKEGRAAPSPKKIKRSVFTARGGGLPLLIPSVEKKDFGKNGRRVPIEGRQQGKIVNH